MKCPECGYEHDEASCPICGAPGTKRRSWKKQDSEEEQYHLREERSQQDFGPKQNDSSKQIYNSQRNYSSKQSSNSQRSYGSRQSYNSKKESYTQNTARPSYDNSKKKHRSVGVFFFVACVFGFFIFVLTIINTVHDSFSNMVITEFPTRFESEDSVSVEVPADPEDSLLKEDAPIEHEISIPEKMIPENNGNWFESGSYVVGQDIEPGEYVVIADEDYCVIKTYSDPSQSIDTLLMSENFTTHNYITLSEGQTFCVEGGSFIWEPDIEAFEPVDGILPPGRYKVGKDIEPGDRKSVV